jgi:hypothetical protein
VHHAAAVAVAVFVENLDSCHSAFVREGLHCVLQPCKLSYKTHVSCTCVPVSK